MIDGRILTCCKCHVPFEIAASHEARLRKTGADFFCPSGHAQAFTKSEDERDQMQNRIAAKEAEIVRLKQRLEYQESLYRCPEKDCGRCYQKRNALANHLQKEHGWSLKQLRRLPANAGPNALNSDVK